jgi:PPM family protein phosphatase
MPQSLNSSSGQCYIGPLRIDNQDSYRISEPADDVTRAGFGCLYAVADGMGGYSYGDIASLQAVNAFFETYYAGRRGAFSRNLSSAMQAANLAVYQISQGLGGGRMGTTLSAACVVGNQLVLAHIGDSRIYLVRDGQATCLTRDHTHVGDLVAMRILSPDKVRQHERRSELNRALGTTLFIKPDIKCVALQPGDAFILCSDGVWSIIEDDELAALASDIDDPKSLCQVIVDLAIRRDSDDNLSTVAVRINDLVPLPGGRDEKRRFWKVFSSIF